MSTRPTLMWFILIGFVVVIIGIILSFFFFGGILVFWIGVILVAFSIIALLYLWLTEAFLTKPRTGPNPCRYMV